jgi:hypothetical protein
MVRSGEQRDPFFTPPVLLSVGLFALNNFWFKAAFPGFLSGKLSDACACFFLPLYLGLLGSRVIGGGPGRRAGYGAAVTVLLMVTVKGTELGSALLNRAVDAVSQPFDLHFSPNVADASDLFALPFALLAVSYARSFERRTRENAPSASSLNPSPSRTT